MPLSLRCVSQNTISGLTRSLVRSLSLSFSMRSLIHSMEGTIQFILNEIIGIGGMAYTKE
jgi:hypothetical protein